MMSAIASRARGSSPEIRRRGFTLVAPGIALVLLLTACGHESNRITGVTAQENDPSTNAIATDEVPPVSPPQSVSDYAALHNYLLDQYSGYYPTPDAAVLMLPSNLANAITIYQGCTPEKAEEQVDPALNTFYEDYPTPESFLQESTGSLYPKIEKKLDEAVKAGDMSQDIADMSLSVIQAMMHLEPFEQQLTNLTEIVDCNGTEFEKEAVGTLLGSSTWWPRHLAPVPMIQAGDKYVPPWLVEALIGMFMDYLGSLYPIPGYGYFASFMVAIAAHTEPADYPHWGVHHKSCGP